MHHLNLHLRTRCSFPDELHRSFTVTMCWVLLSGGRSYFCFLAEVLTQKGLMSCNSHVMTSNGLIPSLSALVELS